MKQKQQPVVKAPRKKISIPWGLIGLFPLLTGLIFATVHFFMQAMNQSTGNVYVPVPGTNDYTQTEGASNSFGMMCTIGLLSFAAVITLGVIVSRIRYGSFADIDANEVAFSFVIAGAALAFVPVIPSFLGEDNSSVMDNAIIVEVEDGLTVDESVQKQLQLDSKSGDKDVYLIQTSDEDTYYKHLGTGEDVLTSMQEGVK